MPARVVCISRTLGAGGTDVGRLVSERLGFRYLDEEIVGRAAEKGQVDVDLVVDAEQRTSIARRLLDQVLWTAAATMTPQFAPSTFSSEPYRKLIVEVIKEAAAAGDVVIVAHAASQALTGRPGVLRVLVTAPDDVRAGRLAEAEGVDGRGGEKLVRESDAARAAYFKEFYGLAEESPTQYDLVVNTGLLTVAETAELVVAAAGFALDAAAG